MHRLIVALMLALAPAMAQGADVKILTAGAMKAVVLELVPQFEKETGHKAVVDNDTAGGLARRIQGGEAFDLAVITPGVLNDLAGKGKVVGDTRVSVARVGVGVVVKEGAPVTRRQQCRCLQEGAARRKDRRLYRSGFGRFERNLSHWPFRQARHRGGDQAEGEAEAGRLCRRPDCQRRSRDRPAPDQRNPPREGREARRPPAGRNPELHHLCGCGERGCQAA